jgi:hypothetical protein
VYYQAEKIVQVAKGVPVGIAISGDGAVGATSMLNLLKDYEQKLLQRDHRYYLDREQFEIRDLVEQMGEFLEKSARTAEAPVSSSLIVSGYSGSEDLPQTWSLQMNDGKVQDLSLIWDRKDFGVNWDGQGACIHRLLMDLALPSRQVETFTDARAFKTVTAEDQVVQEIDSPVIVTPGMPILDAVEVARFLMETSIAFESYRADQTSRTIGGPIDIAIITPHKGFKWVQRKRPAMARRTASGRN